jgi:glutamyl-tRNA reductase
MSFFVVGLNHKDCPVEIREKLHFNPKQISQALGRVKDLPALSELMILSTCNRVEFYGFSEDERLPEEPILKLIAESHSADPLLYQPFLYRHEGKSAIHHLFRVASGLDSLVVGENEILGQLRDAFRMANEAKSVHSLLYRLLEKALKLGKDVRTQTKINEGAVSIPSVAVELAEKIFGKLSGEKIMVLGTGEMSELTLKNLKSAGAQASYVVSRTQERGEAVAAEFDSQWVSYEDWAQYLEQVDILIAATSAPHPIVHPDQVKKAMAKRRRRPLFLIDIAVPRDIDPQVNAIDDVYVYNVDDLKGVSAANLRLRRREIQAAETMVERALVDYQGWLEQLKARPTLESFENFLDEVLEKELSRLPGATLETEEKRKEIKDRIRAKLMHPPLQRIKEASQNGGVTRYLEALHSLFDLDKKD